ncbi:MAG TPA: dihydroorotate dehydrogenase electron transfer subunit [Phycisphaerae bacterium]|nr:dihydroorotate dehydrogenase electron transfer subunit [Phycisphaerae bacterium]HOJ72446.1 dihydroorotate dehydrogenase electron transfer subunit [Phycisphaerae bacterium]HOM49892.1 dihydroorotate dehydrogenase electron transfer subunit [Phycisphaerae bacterium]HON67679.1 dihydroorotate dehydrogenase electron transfer subunit [Phycisphaerae bacterium]HOQ84694.1 dihydroorotate dehydrogenase electron transfer subunit [Phycisphaerae bacterium]
MTEVEGHKSAKGVFLARVVSNESICREHYRLVLSVPELPPAQPGQFIQILCTEPSDLGWTGGAFIRRPFSIGGLRRGSTGVEVEILHRAIGIGTRWLARLQPGDPVSFLGPLGRPFVLPDRGQSPALLVGGGIGLPPLIWLAESLQAAGVPAIAFCGSRTADLLPLRREPGVDCSSGEPALSCREFARAGVPALVATDDGSLGVRGLVPDVFAAYLDRHPELAESAVVYTCGPEPMMRATAEIALRRGLPCQVCLERMMACGMGTCQSCVVRVRDTQAPSDWAYRLCCTDGPVFNAADVIWD